MFLDLTHLKKTSPRLRNKHFKKSLAYKLKNTLRSNARVRAHLKHLPFNSPWPGHDSKLLKTSKTSPGLRNKHFRKKQKIALHGNARAHKHPKHFPFNSPWPGHDSRLLCYFMASFLLDDQWLHLLPFSDQRFQSHLIVILPALLQLCLNNHFVTLICMRW